MNPADEAISDDELRQMFSGDIRRNDTAGFYLDGNVDQGVSERLRSEGVSITDVYTEGQASEQADTRLLARARIMGFVMVTLDRDFRQIHDRVHKAGLTHAGIVLIKSRAFKADPGQLASALARLAAKYEGAGDVLHNQLFRL